MLVANSLSYISTHQLGVDSPFWLLCVDYGDYPPSKWNRWLGYMECCKWMYMVSICFNDILYIIYTYNMHILYILDIFDFMHTIACFMSNSAWHDTCVCVCRSRTGEELHMLFQWEQIYIPTFWVCFSGSGESMSLLLFWICFADWCWYLPKSRFSQADAARLYPNAHPQKK